MRLNRNILNLSPNSITSEKDAPQRPPRRDRTGVPRVACDLSMTGHQGIFGHERKIQVMNASRLPTAKPFATFTSYGACLRSQFRPESAEKRTSKGGTEVETLRFSHRKRPTPTPSCCPGSCSDRSARGSPAPAARAPSPEHWASGPAQTRPPESSRWVALKAACFHRELLSRQR